MVTVRVEVIWDTHIHIISLHEVLYPFLDIISKTHFHAQIQINIKGELNITLALALALTLTRNP